MAVVANVAINLDSRGVPAKLKQIADRGKEVDRSLNGAAAATTKAGREIKTAANGMRYFTDAAGRARKVNGQFVTSTEAAAAGIKKQDTAARSLISTMTKLAATAGAGRVAAGITRTAAGFEEELRRAAAIEGGGNMDQLRQSIERVASTAAGTPTEVAALATSLSRAGFTAQETSESLQGIVTGAEATSVAFDQFGSIVSSSLRAFGLATSETASVVDTLVQTANSSNQTILDLGEALSYAAPGARTLGISISDLSATIGLLADNGIRGSRAGTSLSTGLNRLQLAASGSQEALFEITRGSAMLTKAMDTLGSKVLDAEGNLKPLDEVLLALKGSLDQLNVGQRVELTKALFGEEAGRGFQALLASSEEKIRSMFETIQSSQGKTEQVREEMRGFSDSMKVLGGNVENTTNAIGDKFIVVLQPLVDGLNATLKAASELPKPIRDIGAAAAAAGIAAGGFALALKTLIPTVKLLTGLLGIGGLAGAMAALPWVAVAAGVTALAVAAYDGTVRAQEFQNKLNDLSGTSTELMGKMAGVRSDMEELSEEIAKGGRAGAVAKKKYDALAETLKNLEGTYKIRLEIEELFKGGKAGEKLPAGYSRAKDGRLLNTVSGTTYDVATGAVYTPPKETPKVGDTVGGGAATRGAGAGAAAKDAQRAADAAEREAEQRRINLRNQDQLIERLRAQVVLQNSFTDGDRIMNQLLLDQLEIRQDIENRMEGASTAMKQLLIQEADLRSRLAMDKAAEPFVRAGMNMGGFVAEAMEKSDAEKPNLIRDLSAQVKQLQDELNPVKLATETIINGAFAIGDAFSQAFTDVITGAKSTQEALADTFETIGKAFIDMATQIIAKQIVLITLQTILKALGGGFNFSGGSPEAGLEAANLMGGTGPLDAGMFGFRANGGPVMPGKTYIVGERGPELLTMGSQGGYVHSNTSAAMDRYRNGEGPAGTRTVNVSYSVTEINGMRFVTEEEFRAGMDQAAKRGAKMGQTQTMSTLKNSRSQRSKIGL